MQSLNIISLGMGVQSTAMYLMSCTGELPRADYAVFADTGREKTGTIEALHWLQSWSIKHQGIPITVVAAKNLFNDILNNWNSTGQRFVSIPAFTKNDDGSAGMLRRQCTNEYKIEQVDKVIRSFYNLHPMQRNIPTTIWKGITLDELDRATIPQEKWKTFYYPFCSFQSSNDGHKWLDSPKRTRNDIVNWYNEKGFPIPPKSSCVFCPYQSDASWQDLKLNAPADFADAVLVDEKIRMGCDTKIQQPAFLHKSLKPLKEIVFKSGQPDLWSGECSGNCHT